MNYEAMSREELIHLLDTIQKEKNSYGSHVDHFTTMHELQVHQIELEMQKRELQEKEADLLDSRARYLDLYDYAPVGYMTLNASNLIIEINLTGAALLGRERSRLPGMPFTAFIDKGERQLFRNYMRRCKKSSSKEIATARLNGGAGQEVYVEFHCKPAKVSGSDRMFFQIAMVDITKRELAEQKIHKYYTQLSNLASQASLNEERVQRRIAENLHDHIGQTLTLALMGLAELKQRNIDSDSKKKISDIHCLCHQTITDTRSLILELHPPVLYQLGLSAAVEWLAEQTEERFGLQVRLIDRCDNQPLTKDEAYFLFKAIREILMNAVKHSQASRVKISLSKMPKRLKIVIEDDGKGFDTSAVEVNKNGGYGLFMIRERMEHLGGSFTITSKIGKGSRSTILAPLKHS